MAPHSSTLAWKIPWTKAPGTLQSMGSLRVGHFTFTFHFHALEKEMPTHSSVLAWRISGTGEPGGLLSVGVSQSLVIYTILFLDLAKLTLLFLVVDVVHISNVRCMSLQLGQNLSTSRL